MIRIGTVAASEAPDDMADSDVIWALSENVIRSLGSGDPDTKLRALLTAASCIICAHGETVEDCKETAERFGETLQEMVEFITADQEVDRGRIN